MPRTDGDLLIGYDFQSTGVTITMSVWDSSLNSGDGGWGPQTDITASGHAEGAANTGGGVVDDIKPSGAADPGTDEFGEAGIDIGGLIPPGDGRPCETFGTVSGATRTSGESTSANMEDLVGPAPIDISNCATPSISTLLSESSGAIGDTVHDSASLTGATSDAGGTVTYSVYTDSACSQGQQDAGTVDVTDGDVPDSNGIQFNSAGTFYWQAVYSGDDNNNAATSPCTSEQLVIAPNSPSISTLLSESSGAIGDTVHDSASLTDATSDAGGTVDLHASTPTTSCSNQSSGRRHGRRHGRRRSGLERDPVQLGRHLLLAGRV